MQPDPSKAPHDLAIEFAATIRPPIEATHETSSGQTAAIALVQPKQKPHAARLPAIALGESNDKQNVIPASAATAADLKILKRLGAGGMGVVDLAEQQSLQREVAVKRLHPEHAMSEGHSAALLHEGKVMGRLEHPGIVPVHALGVDAAGQPVLVMKRIDGVSWSTLLQNSTHPLWKQLRADGKDEIDVHLEILRQICNALSFAHARNVIHRDVKPDNVMVGEFGEVYLLDWGVALDLATLTEPVRSSRAMVGTPHFMAPELFDGPIGAHSAQTDVYLLGSTLHRVLTNTPRHTGSTLPQLVLSAHFSKPIAYPRTIPEELATLCNSATSADPQARPQGVESFRRKIAEYLQHKGSIALAQTAHESWHRAVSERDSNSPEARRLLAEAHFGFVQALKQWPDNSQAIEGLEACLVTLTEREIALRHVEAARAYVAELRSPSPALLAALAAVEKSVADEQMSIANAAETAAQMDRSRSAKSRAALAGVGLLCVIALELYTRTAQQSQSSAAAQMLRSDLLMLIVVVIAVAIGRAKLLANRISQQLTFTLVAMITGGVFVDLLGWLMKSAVLVTAVFKFGVAGFVLLVGAITVDRPLYLPSAFILLGSLVMARWPDSAAVVGSLISLIVVLLFLWIPLRKDRRT